MYLQVVEYISWYFPNYSGEIVSSSKWSYESRRTHSPIGSGERGALQEQVNQLQACLSELEGRLAKKS